MNKIKAEVTLRDFCPWNTWQVIGIGDIEDKTTKRTYNNESLNLIREKCLVALVATPIFQLFLFMPINICYRVLRVATLFPLWGGEESSKTFKARLGVIGMDLLRIVSAPLCLIGMMFAALLGATLSPLDGRKVFATLERFQYEFFNRDYVFFPIVNNILIPLVNLISKEKVQPPEKQSNFPPCGFAPCFQPLSEAKVVHLLGGWHGW